MICSCPIGILSKVEETGINAQATIAGEPWLERLKVPNYPIGEAARYAHVRPAVVRDWHTLGRRVGPTLSGREPREGLSYLQLVELAIVAAFRQANFSLQTIREARDYVAKEFGSEFPFAEYRFKRAGTRLLMDFEHAHGEPSDQQRFLQVNKKGGHQGQLAWGEIIGPRLEEFEYEHELAVRWHVAGADSDIIIDPRISFGAPTVKGVPTWLLKERWGGGEPVRETASDLGLHVTDVKKALEFEGINISAPQPDRWLN